MEDKPKYTYKKYYDKYKTDLAFKEMKKEANRRYYLKKTAIKNAEKNIEKKRIREQKKKEKQKELLRLKQEREKKKKEKEEKQKQKDLLLLKKLVEKYGPIQTN